MTLSKSRKVAVRELLAPLIIAQNQPTGGSVGVDLATVLWLLTRGKKRKKPKLDFLRLLKIHKALGTLDWFLANV
jgi:hypothetical protein